MAKRSGYTPTPANPAYKRENKWYRLMMHKPEGRGGTTAVWGYTMLEMVVILAIITAISAILLSTFPRFNESASLIRSQQAVALAVRQAQNIALSVSNVSVTYDPSFSGASKPPIVGPSRVGIYIDKTVTPAQVILFVDLNGDGIYKPTDDAKIGEAVTLAGITTIGQITANDGSSANNVSITFRAPEADAIGFLMYDGGSIITLQDPVAIKLATPNLPGVTRTVKVWRTGQVSLETP